MAYRLLSKVSPALGARVPPAGSTSITFVRHAGGKGYWNPDWRADTHIPVDKEERAIAARKYNLHPDDYDTWKDSDKIPYGDYPKLPVIAASERDPYEPWDYPVLRRNFGEPLPIYYDMYTLERCDTSRQHRSTLYMWTCLLSTIAGFFFLGYITRKYHVFIPTMPKEYPYNDLWIARGGDPATEPKVVHYDFPGGHHHDEHHH